MTQLVVVFDWDCTITSKHMFKTLAGRNMARSSGNSAWQGKSLIR